MADNNAISGVFYRQGIVSKGFYMPLLIRKLRAILDLNTHSIQFNNLHII